VPPENWTRKSKIPTARSVLPRGGWHGCPSHGRRRAVDARLILGGRVRYVDESRIGAVGAFAVNGGSLTELAGSPASLTAGATPSGIAVSWFLQQRTLRRYDAVPVTAASRPVKSSPQGPQARR
jgi:hypothetical protein